MALVTPFDGFTYHPHQVTAVTWMTAREDESAVYVRGGILADEMGLGKTWTTIGLLLNTVVPNTLLLVPPVLQPQWSEALTRAHIPYNTLTPKGWRHVAGTAGCTVYMTTYDRATHNIQLLTDPALVFDRIVCDEGHLLRNGPITRRFAALIRINAPRRWILSGTPVQNNKRDFTHLLQFLGMTGVIMDHATIAQAMLLRRTVGEVRDVVTTMPAMKPVHITHTVTMPPDSEEDLVFKTLVGRFNHAIDSHASSLVILELYLRIRQFLAHPAIYVDAMKSKFSDRYGRKAWEGTASKMTAFGELVRRDPKPPTIVFGTFRSELDLAASELTGAGYAVWQIRGGMTDEQREHVCVQSRLAAADGTTPVALVVQIVTGNAGLNLQHCSRIIFLSSHWNPAIVDQAVARAYRMGQTQTVTVYHLLLANDAERNIDRRMVKRHGEKRAIATHIHPKLFCDSAVDSRDVLEEIDAVATAALPAFT